MNDSSSRKGLLSNQQEMQSAIALGPKKLLHRVSDERNGYATRRENTAICVLWRLKQGWEQDIITRNLNPLPGVCHSPLYQQPFAIDG
jgi:hypothetical protein